MSGSRTQTGLWDPSADFTGIAACGALHRQRLGVVIGRTKDYEISEQEAGSKSAACVAGKTASGAAAGYYDHSSRSDWQQCPETGISNLLCDLRHLCDALGLDFAYLDSHSNYDYMFERD